MNQHTKQRTKALKQKAYSLIEVSFVMLLVGVVITPIILSQNAQNALFERSLKSLESSNLNDTALIELLQNTSRKSELVKEITQAMAELATGAKIVDKNIASREELYDPLATSNGNYINTLNTFFINIAPSGPPVYAYKLPNEPNQQISTSQKTFFLKSSNGKYIPLFTYNWEFRDQSSNTNDENQNTSTGTYLVRGELKIYEIASPVAQRSLSTVVQSTPTESITSNFNVRNDQQVQALKSKIPRVLINFTFDMSRGACYSPATSQYSRRLTYGSASWATIPHISYNSGKGLLCAPYFEPSTNNMAYGGATASPWANGDVYEGIILKPHWYDIYYNDTNKLFWTEGGGPIKQSVWTANPVAMGFAQLYQDTWQQTEHIPNTHSSMPSGKVSPNVSATYEIRRPILRTGTIRNFDDGDFDKTALNYLRCSSYNGSKNVGAWRTGDLWAADVHGPNENTFNDSSSTSYYPAQSNCRQFNASWRTPANLDLTFPIHSVNPLKYFPNYYVDSLSPDPLIADFPNGGQHPQGSSALTNKQWGFSRFWIRQNAGNYGGEVFTTVEAARMAISGNLGPIGATTAWNDTAYSTQKFWANSAARTMETVWSDDDKAVEEQRWISGVEFQRSAALITMFRLLDQSNDYKQRFEVSLMLNNPGQTTEGSSANNPTTYVPYPDATNLPYNPTWVQKLTKATIRDATQAQFKEVMKHLYGMNRLLGSVSPPSGFGSPFTNAGTANYRHLANLGRFDVKKSIEDFRRMLTETAQLKCQQDLGLTLGLPAGTPCNNADEWSKHLGYDHYVNIIYFPSDMSGNSSSSRFNPSKNNSNGELNTAAADNLKKDLGIMNDPTSMIPEFGASITRITDAFDPANDPFEDKITYVLVVHKDQHDYLKERVRCLEDLMRNRNVPFVYKEVDSVRDYEDFVDQDLIRLFQDKSEGGTAGTGEFNNMNPEDYEYI